MLHFWRSNNFHDDKLGPSIIGITKGFVIWCDFGSSWFGGPLALVAEFFFRLHLQTLDCHRRWQIIMGYFFADAITRVQSESESESQRESERVSESESESERVVLVRVFLRACVGACMCACVGALVLDGGCACMCVFAVACAGAWERDSLMRYTGSNGSNTPAGSEESVCCA